LRSQLRHEALPLRRGVCRRGKQHRAITQLAERTLELIVIRHALPFALARLRKSLRDRMSRDCAAVTETPVI
jgi:hypothetical protein